MKYLPLILFLLFLRSIQAQVIPKKILITYQSKTNHTKTLAAEVAKGVQSVKDVQLIFKPISETTQQDLLEADVAKPRDMQHTSTLDRPNSKRKQHLGQDESL